MIHVTCAIIKSNNTFLICQRSDSMSLPLKWEFPGGKVEPGESLENCLLREIKEELHVAISIQEALTPIIHHYDSFSITLYPFICHIIDGKITLTEHINYKWVERDEFIEVELAPADLPIITQL